MPELTPQQKLLEKLYRSPSGNPAPSKAVSKLKTAYAKPSVGAVGKKAGAKASQSAIKASARRQAKVAAANNISKFGKGVKATYGSALKATKQYAVKAGLTKQGFGKLVAKVGGSKLAGLASKYGGKLLAQTNKPGVLLLGTVAYEVWKSNFQKIGGIYGAEPSIAVWYPIAQKQLLQQQEPALEWYGGQDPSVQYKLRYSRANVENGQLVNYSGYFLTSTISATPPISGVRVLHDGASQSSTGAWSATGSAVWDVYATDATGEEKLIFRLFPGEGIKIWGFEPANGSTETDPGGGTSQPTPPPQILSSGSTNATIPTVEPNQKPQTSPAKKSKPSTKPLAPVPPDTNQPTQPVPSQIPQSSPSPTDLPTSDPQKPSDTPPVITKDKAIPTTKKKPKASGKTQYFPDALPKQLPGTEIIKDPKTGLPTRITRRYADPAIPEEATEVTTVIPPIPRLNNPTPTLTERNPKPTPLPPATKINPCKKGCGGSGGGGLSQADSNNLGQLNTGLQALDLGLLKKIDNTTTATRSFMTKAWSLTKADKILNGLSAVASIHNAAMLSQDVGQTLGDAATNALGLFNITDADGEAIDVNSAIGGAVKNKINTIFPEAATTAISSVWLGLNRIHQAVSSTVSAIQGTKNALLEADEITGGHIAKIGNALQDQGVIEEESYDFMNPEPDYKAPFGGILGKIENIENIAERVSSVVSTGLEIKETSTELITTSNELNQATSDFLTNFKTERDTEITESASPEIDRLNLLKQETEDI